MPQKKKIAAYSPTMLTGLTGLVLALLCLFELLPPPSLLAASDAAWLGLASMTLALSIVLGRALIRTELLSLEQSRQEKKESREIALGEIRQEYERPGAVMPSLCSTAVECSALSLDMDRAEVWIFNADKTAAELVVGFNRPLRSFFYDKTILYSETPARFSKLLGGESLFSDLGENKIEATSPIIKNDAIHGFLRVTGAADDDLPRSEISSLLEQAALLIGRFAENIELRSLQDDLNQKSLAIEHSMDGVAILDSSGRFIYMNKAHAEVYGYSNPQELIGQHWHKLYDQESIEEFETKLIPSLHKVGRLRAECTGHKANGYLFPQEISLAKLRDGGIICIVRDISERRAAEERILLNQKKQALLNDLARAIGYGATYHQTIERTLEQLTAYFPECRVSYSTVDSQGAMTVASSKQTPDKMSLAEVALDLNSAPEYLAAVRALKTVVVGDMRERSPLSPFSESLLSMGAKACIDVPLLISENEIGVLCFDRERPLGWSELEISCAEEVSDYLSLALREAHDREDRDRAHQALTESEERFRNLAENAPILIWLTNADLSDSYFNRGWSKMTGLPQDEIGSRWFDLLHAQDRGRVSDQIREAQRMHSRFSLECRIMTTNGDYRWLHIEGSPRFQADGSFMGFISCGFDIDDRKQAEALMITKERRLIAQNSAIASLSRSPAISAGQFESSLVEICEAAVETIGCSRVNIWGFDDARSKITCLAGVDRLGASPKGLSISKVDAPTYFAGIEKERALAITDAHNHPASRPFLSGYLLPNGIGALLDAPIIISGVTVGVLCHEHVGGPRNWTSEELTFAGALADFVARVFQDRDKKRLEAELTHAQKLEAVGQLAGGIAHDFNNLLTGILGYSSILKEDLALPAEASAIVSKIETAGISGRELTKKLLGFARKGKKSHVILDLHQAVAEAVEIAGGSLGEHITIEQNLSARSSEISGDIVQLSQIILNLALNSKDAMDPALTGRREGILRIATRNIQITESRSDLFSHARPGSYVELSIQDSGCGIPESIKDKIFEPFFTTKSQDKGSGLGLSMVYGIVKNHGGSVALETSPGLGTTFRLIFPLAAPSLAEKIEISSKRPLAELARTGVIAGKTLLVIDDDPIVLDAAKSMLSTAGCKVLAARSGDEALDIVRKHGRSIDLAVIDMLMPKMSGIECLDKLREINPGLRAVWTTGYEGINPDEPTNPPTSGFIQKPFSIVELAAAVTSALAH